MTASASSSLIALLMDNITTLLRHHDNRNFVLLTFCPKGQNVEVRNHDLIRSKYAGQWAHLKEEKQKQLSFL